MPSYKDLEIYQNALALFFKIHRLSLKLPKYELYEQGSQIRRSADSVVSNIVEGYGRKEYKSDYIRFLVMAHASGLETLNHIKKLKTLYPKFGKEFEEVYDSYDLLNAKIYRFIEYVKKHWKTHRT